jgi:hypothetical protein
MIFTFSGTHKINSVNLRIQVKSQPYPIDVKINVQTQQFNIKAAWSKMCLFIVLSNKIQGSFFFYVFADLFRGFSNLLEL